MTTAIKIEGLSKKYVIGHHRQGEYTTFRDVLMHKFRSVGQRVRHPLSANKEIIEQEELWALRDINLEIKQGERVGIIGRNGAGKSTLLKVLSRITEPSEGRFALHGRVASLLEVGTGFHPELTGRENIFLNGAILGMSKAEIKDKFDEIVDFAETEKFLDTPVKRYSSGMYVRLAFAVAAHLEPEILIVDEVLAVGDAAFQKKCLGKMKEVGKEGRTVLFVSHNIAAISNLCSEAVQLEEGRVVCFGEVSTVVSKYMHSFNENTGCEYSNNGVVGTGVKVVLLKACVVDSDDRLAASLFIDKANAICLVWQLQEAVPYMRTGVEVVNSLGVVIFSSMDTDSTDWLGKSRDPGVYSGKIRMPAYILMPGQYSVNVFAGMPGVERFMEMENILQFEVVDNQSHISHVKDENRSGCIATPIDWKVKFRPVD